MTFISYEGMCRSCYSPDNVSSDNIAGVENEMRDSAKLESVVTRIPFSSTMATSVGSLSRFSKNLLGDIKMNTIKNLAILMALSATAILSTGCEQVSRATTTVTGWVGYGDDPNPELTKKVEALGDATSSATEALEEANNKLAEIREMADQAEALQKQYSELSASVDKAVSEVNTAMVGLEEYVPTMQEKLAEAKDRIKTALKSLPQVFPRSASLWTVPNKRLRLRYLKKIPCYKS